MQRQDLSQIAIELAGISQQIVDASGDPQVRALDTNQMRRNVNRLISIFSDKEVLAKVRHLSGQLNEKILEPASFSLIAYSLALVPLAQLDWWPDLKVIATRGLLYGGAGAAGTAAVLRMLPENAATRIASLGLEKFTESAAIFMILNQVIPRIFVSSAFLAGMTADEINSDDVANPVAISSSVASAFIASLYLIRKLQEKFPNMLKVPTGWEEIAKQGSKILDFGLAVIVFAAPFREMIFTLETKMSSADAEQPETQLARDAGVLGFSLLLNIVNQYITLLPKNIISLETAADIALGIGMILTGQAEESAQLESYDPYILIAMLLTATLGPIVRQYFAKERTSAERFEEIPADVENPREASEESEIHVTPQSPSIQAADDASGEKELQTLVSSSPPSVSTSRYGSFSSAKEGNKEKKASEPATPQKNPNQRK